MNPCSIGKRKRAIDDTEIVFCLHPARNLQALALFRVFCAVCRRNRQGVGPSEKKLHIGHPGKYHKRNIGKCVDCVDCVKCFGLSRLLSVVPGCQDCPFVPVVLYRLYRPYWLRYVRYDLWLESNWSPGWIQVFS